MITSEEPGRWHVFQRHPDRAWPELPVPLKDEFGTLQAWLRKHDAREGQRFLIDPYGRPDARVNAFFASVRMLRCNDSTNRMYAYSLASWLTFLDRLESDSPRTWDLATPEDIDAFKFWRLTDEANPGRVSGNTWHRDLAALNSFYQWAHRRYHVTNPVLWREHASSTGDVAASEQAVREHGRGVKIAEAAGVRDRNVKWLTPRGYEHWLDLGLRGVGLDGRDAPGWRGRNTQRDAAFANLLYKSGLRLQEGGSLLVVELPPHTPNRRFYTSRLAAACAKRGRGRVYWMPPEVRDELDYYLGPEGERSRAVARAQQAGRYENVPGLRLLVDAHKNAILLRRPRQRAQEAVRVPLDALSPNERRRLFRETNAGLEPLALWLNENGLPRPFHSWEYTFYTANRRIRRLGIEDTWATPHMLRHSCALAWYATGRLLYEHRFGHLNEKETRDFRAQFGNTWDLVRIYLGHRDVETTRNIYLEPFQGLEFELVMEVGRDADYASFAQVLFRDYPQVLSGPEEWP